MKERESRERMKRTGRALLRQSRQQVAERGGKRSKAK